MYKFNPLMPNKNSRYTAANPRTELNLTLIIYLGLFTKLIIARISIKILEDGLVELGSPDHYQQ